jgi:RimJ/RimL family protein N-acetyltransferase
MSSVEAFVDKMPSQPDTQTGARTMTEPVEVVSTDWRIGLPTLGHGQVTLRDLRMSDAASLFAMVGAHEVARFISPPPSTVEGFERFIAWTHRQREAGAHVCFAVVPAGYDEAVGIIQVRQLEHAWGAAEWGFAIGAPYWPFRGSRTPCRRFRIRADWRAPPRSSRGGS